jgi:hypothetical protein
MRRLVTALLLTCFVPAVLLAAHAAPPSLTGRWVNADLPNSAGPFVLFFQPAGKVLNLIPAPQFGATYRFEGKRLELISTAGPLGPDRTSLILTLEDNVLQRDGQPLLGRLEPASAKAANVRGTWRLLAPSSMEQFWTFRSDGQVILEVGIPGTDTLEGDTLKLARASFTLRRSGDRLYVEGPGQSYRFVRRPWGCFGLPAEANLSECRRP